MSYLEINGAKLFYECRGSGNSPLVFVHGFGCGHEDWRYQVEHFVKTNLTVTCDLRGHGRSTNGPEDCTIETLGDDLALVARSPTGARLLQWQSGSNDGAAEV